MPRKQSMSESTKQFYISNKNESIPMFESRFMEFFSHVHPAVPVILYMPPIVYMLYRAFMYQKMSILIVVVFFVFGVLIWTLLEYVVHRYVFHYEPKSRAGKTLHFIIHGVHHDVVFRDNVIGFSKSGSAAHIGIRVSAAAKGLKADDNDFQNVATRIEVEKKR